jgi:hypothetical protein
MKHVIFGSALCLSGIILYGMRMIAASIYSGYGAIKNAEYGFETVGALSLWFSVALFIIGLIIALYGILNNKDT